MHEPALSLFPVTGTIPLLDFKIYMFSGILVIIVTLIGMLLTALNLVREKEMGTTEQINVTPNPEIPVYHGKTDSLYAYRTF